MSVVSKANDVLKDACAMLTPSDLEDPAAENLIVWNETAAKFASSNVWVQALLLGLRDRHEDAKQVLDSNRVSDMERQLLMRVWQAARCCEVRWKKACSLRDHPERTIWISFIVYLRDPELRERIELACEKQAHERIAKRSGVPAAATPPASTTATATADSDSHSH